MSWDDAKAHAAWLSHRLGLRGDEVVRHRPRPSGICCGRIPTPHIGGVGTSRSRQSGLRWWVTEPSDRQRHVGFKPLRDMLGNVFEGRKTGTLYQEADVTDPVGPAGGSQVLRGGSEQRSEVLLPPTRFSGNLDGRVYNVGFPGVSWFPIEPLATAPLTLDRCSVDLWAVQRRRTIFPLPESLYHFVRRQRRTGVSPGRSTKGASTWRRRPQLSACAV